MGIPEMVAIVLVATQGLKKFLQNLGANVTRIWAIILAALVSFGVVAVYWDVTTFKFFPYIWQVVQVAFMAISGKALINIFKPKPIP